MSWERDRYRQEQRDRQRRIERQQQKERQRKERIANNDVSIPAMREREWTALGLGKKQKRRQRWINIGTSNPMNILTLILAILLGASFIAVLMGREVRTVSGLLEALQSAPDIPVEDIITAVKGIPTLRGDWGIVDGLRSGINTIINSINTVYTTVAWLCMTMANFALMALWAVGWIFGF